MSPMTPRERLLRALHRQEPDRVPCHLAAIRWIRSHYGCASPRQQLRFAADFGGYILCTAESIDPNTPPECLQAAVAAAHEYGGYRHA